MERYKRVVSGGIDRLGPELFEKERFFDFTDGETNQDPEEAGWASTTRHLEAKWDCDPRRRQDDHRALRPRARAVA